ncbi:MAG: hypothetical protein ACI4F3_11945, partial [Enterocloster sp.]
MEEEKLENMTLGQLTSLRAEKYPNREAVVDVRQNRRLTYGQLKELSGSLAGAVLRLGMEKGVCLFEAEAGKNHGSERAG